MTSLYELEKSIELLNWATAFLTMMFEEEYVSPCIECIKTEIDERMSYLIEQLVRICIEKSKFGRIIKSANTYEYDFRFIRNSLLYENIYNSDVKIESKKLIIVINKYMEKNKAFVEKAYSRAIDENEKKNETEKMPIYEVIHDLVKKQAKKIKINI